jgi:hypothetical protein
MARNTETLSPFGERARVRALPLHSRQPQATSDNRGVRGFGQFLSKQTSALTPPSSRNASNQWRAFLPKQSHAFRHSPVALA